MSSSVVNSIVSSFRSINWSDVRRNTVLLTWLVAGVASLAVPLIQWFVQRSSYYQSYGVYIEYEQQQRDYEEGQNNDNNNNNDDGSSYYKDCGWWNLVCRQKQANLANYYGNDNNNNNNDQSIPNWFLWMGGQTEEMQRWKEENTGRRAEDEEGNSAGQVVVVVWMMLLFAAVLSYGAYTLYHRKPRFGLVVAMVVVAQILVLNLLLLPSLLSTEGNMFEDSIYGWYGQTGVLMVYVDFWALVFTLGFLVVFYVIHRLEKKKSIDENATTPQEVAEPGEYYQAPTIQLTSSNTNNV
jgi:cbb3-type cytochrome oxidase subunit 3